ncbi:MAG: serine/threonine protein kinase, partial [Pirellulales bacterium]|nr:serine/threonine protein kinase [Pirellulales bacterium]
QLPPQEAADVESHISECEPCCETMLGLSSDDTFVALLQEAKQVTDPTLDGNGASVVHSASQDVPASLDEHPRYEIVGLIGKGGMGDVYKAKHRMMERTVALKIINRELVRNPEAVNRFQREVKAAAQLSHPHIVTAHDAEQAGDIHFLVMEYVDGVDLSLLVKDRGALPVSDSCDYIRQAALGLQHACELDMVHRDIKPHNLMVTAEGTVKILDFGLASLAPEPSSDRETVTARGDLTAAGSIMGTPDFISPEQATDARKADVRSDIYSLGTTLYFLLAGRPPFADGNVLHKLKSHAHADPESLQTLREDIPADLAAVVSKMIAKDPDDRFQTPADVAKALEPFATSATASEHSQTPSPQLRPSSNRSRFGKAVAAATLLIATIIAAVVFYLQTNNGAVRIEVADPSLQVIVDGQTITMKNGAKTLTIRAGQQVLIVRQGGSDFAFETNRFQIRRNDKIAFKVERLAGEVVVTKNGQRFDVKPLPGVAADVNSGELTPSDTVPAEIAALLAETGLNETQAAEFKETLYTVLSQAASIPNTQWERFATDPSGSMAGIEGAPLSLILLQLNPVRAAQENPAALNDFRCIAAGLPRPSDLARAMSPSSPHGYVSMIQPEYIQRTPIKHEDRRLRGSVEFEAPNLYAGKVDFVIQGAGPRMRVVEFELPNYGIVITRDDQGIWHRRQASESNTSQDDPAKP